MSNFAVALVSVVVAMACLAAPSAANFYRDTVGTFGNDRVKVMEGGRGLSLSLDQSSGSGFQSKKDYLFGRFDMQLMLVPDNSAGTVTTFYLSSLGASHDEIDFEFLGNTSGQPYTIHTNVFAQGKGNKEKQFHLWFMVDNHTQFTPTYPTAAFHTYSIVWNPHHIIFMVDNSPIRVFNNHEALRIPFPKNQAMRVYYSLWNADDCATQGGWVKTDWSKAPFVAFYRNLNFNATWQTQELDGPARNRLSWVQQNHMVYDYCSDAQRFPQGTSVECKRSS